MPVPLVVVGVQLVHLLLNDAITKHFGLDLPHPSVTQMALGACVTLPLDLATTVVNMVLVLGALQQLDDGDVIHWQGAWDRGSAPGWPLFWASVRYQVLCILGFFALLVPGIVYAARKQLYAPLMVLGGMDADEAFRQSPEWLFGHKLRLASAYCALTLLSALITWFFKGGPLEGPVQWLLTPLLTPLFPILEGVVFLQLRALRGEPVRAHN